MVDKDLSMSAPRFDDLVDSYRGICRDEGCLENTGWRVTRKTVIVKNRGNIWSRGSSIRES